MSNQDWWAKKLGTPQQQQPVARQSIPMPQSQQPMTPYTPVQPQVQQTKAQSLTQTQNCPECGGNNYMSPQPNIALRCYDCGYPVQQSGSRYGALTGARVEGSAKGAIGNSQSSGFSLMPDGYNPDGSKR